MADKGILPNIAVVSVDLFQTLVNVDTRCHPFWQQVLGTAYTAERANAYWVQLKSFLHWEYREMFASQYSFVRARTVAERSFEKMFNHLGMAFDPVLTTDIFIKEHRLVAPFEDTAPFLEAVGRLFPVCLVSDADEAMIGPLRHLHPFDRIFTSEQVGAYKNSPGGELFRSVVEYYNIKPGYILHIGDSPFDVLGAAKAGLVTCWLNRFDRLWEQEVQPHHVVTSLRQAAALLGIAVDRGQLTVDSKADPHAARSDMQ